MYAGHTLSGETYITMTGTQLHYKNTLIEQSLSYKNQKGMQ